MRLILALRCFFLILFARRLPADALKLLPARPEPAPPPAPAPAPEPKPDKTAEQRGAIQMLALLQREGRLIDFLEEEIATYTDAQVGAAVRDIHKGCRRALADHVGIKPVLPGADNATIRIEPGFDPSRIRLVGNVVGEPPFTGVLKHPGWQGDGVKLPSVPASVDASVIAPAEVELP